MSNWTHFVPYKYRDGIKHLRRTSRRTLNQIYNLPKFHEFTVLPDNVQVWISDKNVFEFNEGLSLEFQYLKKVWNK